MVDYVSILMPEINGAKLAIQAVFAVLINVFGIFLAYAWFNRAHKFDSKAFEKWNRDFGGSVSDYKNWNKQNSNYSRRSSGRRYYSRNYRRRGRW